RSAVRRWRASGERSQMVTGADFRARRSASVLPHAPPPRMVTAGSDEFILEDRPGTRLRAEIFFVGACFFGAVASVVFCPVECLVGFVEQRHLVRVMGREGADAATARDSDAGAVAEVHLGGFKIHAEAFGGVDGADEICFGEHDGEFLAAVASADVAFAEGE